MTLNWNTKRRWMHLICVAALALIAGCASTGAAVLHSLHYCNAGHETLTRIRISYGSVIWPRVAERNYKGTGRDQQCLGGSAFADQMPVPELMRIEWKLLDGREFAVDIPVRSKLMWGFAPSRIQVQFLDETVKVIQYAYPSKADERIKQIYP